ERYFDGEDWIESEDKLCLVLVKREEMAEVFAGTPFANDMAAEDIIVPIKSAGNIEYRCIGRFAGTDKYALDPGYRVSADARKSEWSYDGDEGDPIYFMFVSGVVNSAEQMIDLMKSAYEEESEDGVWSFTGTQGAGVSQAGLDYRYLCTAVIQTEADDGQGRGWQYEYTRHLYAYVVVGEEACVLVTVYGGAKSQDEVPGQDVLLERALEFIDLISLPENLEYATAWNADVTVQTGERQASVPAYESIVGKWMLRELAFNEDVRRSGSSFEGLLFEFTPEGEILYHDVTSFTYRYDEENVWLGAATLSQYMLMEGREQAVSYTLCGDRLLLKGLWGNDAGHLFTRLSEGEAMYGEWGLARPLDQEEMERFLQAPDDFEYEPADLGNLRVTVEITAEGSFTVTWTIEFLYYRLLEENTLALCEAPDSPTDMTLQYVLEDGKLTFISEDTLPETGEVMNLRAVLERAE
ncbi:MAG: hypothetical protein IJU28_04540, partial [Clostridia bacterium]|nr:hypothetical protein [Clostridia bacterium]